MKVALKLLVSVIACLLAGLVGLALVFRDLPVGPGPGLVVSGGLFYLVVGYGLTRWHGGGRLLLWGLAPGWGLALLGFIGLWVSMTDPPSGHWVLALLFLLGPAAAGLAGAALGRRAAHGRAEPR